MEFTQRRSESGMSGIYSRIYSKTLRKDCQNLLKDCPAPEQFHEEDAILWIRPGILIQSRKIDDQCVQNNTGEWSKQYTTNALTDDIGTNGKNNC